MAAILARDEAALDPSSSAVRDGSGKNPSTGGCAGPCDSRIGENRGDALDLLLRDLVRRPFRYTHDDCCTAMCDWVAACGYAEPGACDRRCCDDEAGARAFMARHGGLAAYMSARFAESGLARTLRPVRGDVGLVSAAVGNETGFDVLLGAICLAAGVTQPVWWIRTRYGAVVAPRAFLRAWRVEARQARIHG